MANKITIRNLPKSFTCENCNNSYKAKKIVKHALKNRIKLVNDLSLYSSQVVCSVNETCNSKWYFYIDRKEDLVYFLGNQSNIRSDYYDQKNIGYKNTILHNALHHFGKVGKMYEGISMVDLDYLRKTVELEKYNDVKEYLVETCPVFIFRTGEDEYLVFSYYRNGDHRDRQIRFVSIDGGIPQPFSDEMVMINEFTKAISNLTLYGILPVNMLGLVLINIIKNSNSI